MSSMKRWLCLGLLTTSLAGCSDGAEKTDEPIEQPKPAGYQLGDNDNATLRPVFQATAPHEATALEFNRARPEEHWVLLRQPYEGVPCTEDIKQGCAVLEGRVAIVFGASGETQTDEVKTDPNAWHFMRRPVAISFGAGQTFATCSESVRKL